MALLGSLDHLFGWHASSKNHQSARPPSRFSSQMEELRATMRQVQVACGVGCFTSKLKKYQDISRKGTFSKLKGNPTGQISSSVLIPKTCSKFRALFGATRFGHSRSPDLSRWPCREEDSERSSDEARQCEAEAALELSKVAALLLGRSFSDRGRS